MEDERWLAYFTYKGRKYALFSCKCNKPIPMEGIQKIGKVINGNFEQKRSIRQKFSIDHCVGGGVNYEIYQPSILNEEDGPIYGTIEFMRIE